MLRAVRALSLILVVACSSPAKKPAPVVEPPPPAPEPAVQPQPPAPPPPQADASPTVPSGTAAARDAELAKQAAAYVDAFSNKDATFTRDGKRIVFSSTRDGIPQLYFGTVGKAAEPAQRLLELPQRVMGGPMPKDGKTVLFRADVGADENWSIYRVGLDGKNVVELTPGDRISRDQPILADGQPTTMFFSARKMTEAKTTVYSASLATPGPAKVLFTTENPGGLSDVDAKGTTGLVVEFPKRVDTSLFRVDFATGKADKLYPREGQVTILDAKFSADGKQVYVATDAGGAQYTLFALDAKSGKQLAKYGVSPATAEITALQVAKKGGLVALSITAGSHSEVVLLDGKKLAPTKQKIRLPLGQGTAHAFSEDGKRLSVTWSTPSSPHDVIAINTATGATEPLRMEARPSLANMPKIEVQVIDIPAFDGGKIPTNVYVPNGEHDKPHPVIVSYHGGPSSVSMIRWQPSLAFWMSLGYVLVEPNVRGSSGYGRAFEAGDNGKKRLDAFKDIEASGRWVAKQPWADKNRLVVYGGSYGGYTVLIALSHWPDIWRAGVNLFGVVNLKTFMATTSGLIRKIFLDEFGDPDKDADFLAQISPMTHVAKIVDPVFVYAGANDPRVPRSESDMIVKALRQRGLANEYIVANDEGHSLARSTTQIQVMSRVARFLETALK